MGKKQHKLTQNSNGNGRKTKSNKGATLAERADKFDCYQRAVQHPDHEVAFFEQAFRDAYGRKPHALREDFCGTFAVCCEWVQTHKLRTAIGVDLCEETLQWGRERNLSALTKEQQGRVQVLKQDVRRRNRPTVDVLAAQNFSFWIFKSRQEVIDYFVIARANLKPEGIMVMDMMGGSDCFVEGQIDKRDIGKGKKRFQYRWKQVSYNPINAATQCEISFRFRDGSRLEQAFQYDWRFWTIPEVREMLAEAGFSESHVYWEQEDEDDPDVATWTKESTAPSDPAWVAYVVAVR